MADANSFRMPQAPAKVQQDAAKLRETNRVLAEAKEQMEVIKQRKEELEDSLYDWLEEVDAPVAVPITLGLGISGAIAEGSRTESINETLLLREAERYHRASHGKISSDPKAFARAIVDSIYENRTVEKKQSFKFIDAEALARASLKRKATASKKKKSAKKAKKAAAQDDDDEEDDDE